MKKEIESRKNLEAWCETTYVLGKGEQGVRFIRTVRQTILLLLLFILGVATAPELHRDPLMIVMLQEETTDWTIKTTIWDMVCVDDYTKGVARDGQFKAR